MVTRLLKKRQKKVPYKKILKKIKTSYKIPEYKEEGIFDDPNRFFKEEMEDIKKNMFLR